MNGLLFQVWSARAPVISALLAEAKDAGVQADTAIISEDLWDQACYENLLVPLPVKLLCDWRSSHAVVLQSGDCSVARFSQVA